MGKRLGRRLLQDERDQPTERAPLLVSLCLQALVELPVDGCCNPLRPTLKKAEALDGGAHAAESLTPAT